MYLITHSDLSSGYQTAQIAHVVADFVHKNPAEAANWHSASNTIVVLEADSLEHLHYIHSEALAHDIAITAFLEPDLGNQMTALALHPNSKSAELLCDLPLVGRRSHEQSSRLQQEQKMRAIHRTQEEVSS